MLTAVKAYGAWPSIPTLPIDENGRADTDPIQIRDIQGLEPVKADVNTTPFGSVDGASYAGSQVGPRNIVITFGLNPDWVNWTYASLRRLLYTYFMSKIEVRLVFESDDMPPVEIYGYVEGAEPNPFSKDVEFQVSIICPDPYFTEIEPTILTGVSNDGSDPLEIAYAGSVEAGVNVEISKSADPPPVVLGVQIGNPGETFFQFFATVSDNTYIVVNSLPGQKYLQKIDQTTGVITNLLKYMAQGSTWPTLKPGNNNFYVFTDAGVQDWRLTYYTRYGGL